MLKVSDLAVHYGAIQAVSGVDFTVNDGEIVTLIGANGAGKSTILKTISGLLRPSRGSIDYDGQNLAKLAASKIVKAGIAQVPEGRHVFEGLTVSENLRMGAYLTPKTQSEQLTAVFDQFPVLKERRNQDAATLSGGEQQMLAMGRAMMAKPKLLLLDEPSMGLAPIYINKIFDIIKAIHAQGVTVLLIEQNAQQALQIADRAYVLANGQVKMTGTGQELLASADVQATYLGG
ncbi:MAG: ABC transporter ATP-binding protein [Lactobacillus sp.]|jgi:branched-chain amino acid transport system ATP-binding protein|uniref:ABC transporter ATP-binding protein n=1 Tax=Lacticaseibacillus suilingensis TaxID=2799577 RepID=A0ABW4BCB7_9LACO|nr:ABC transporter ATP-binding protein [Lacticaseibacillus suilingensis]MCI1895168.1 ABC transporter ATP-binding protein [Lactobacillus sp.]MCI1917920.1 ABC transporter ATP-binding protein [Lactobacillus sp.]MCI1940930.1 ABC transporter ATP-binding protein [Lactobacillus sp.]MCI1971597.1 ABC transporter ATP-binding protein [Lactobacillus sp.]MCI2017472.1 ABC transporter ATP-binding protein [Lactobacillus sp.]